MSEPENLDLNKLNLTRTYTPEELEQINKYLKVRTNFEDGRLISLPQTPIAHEAVVHEISRQLELGWLIDPKRRMICTYKKNNNEIIRNNCKWEDLDGGDTLPGFTLNISIIENIVSQECNEIEDKCPYCDKHFFQVFAMLKHIARVHIVVK
ncbi:unnamed protein product [Rhizophagus irregularis]|nr:unnamed protein product [Rhizophagus irregularis]